jgi:hypothetical protein
MRPEPRPENLVPGTPPLGSLSRQEEVGNGGPGTISTGEGDHGGVSYGSYQLSSRMGTAQRFVDSLSTTHPEYHAALSGHAPATAEFNAAWSELARRDPAGFDAAQHDFIQATHYDPAAAGIQQDTGLDLSTRSATLRDVVWSTAVQHGPGRDRTEGARQIVDAALAGRDPATVTDEELISDIYAERGRVDENGELAHFSSNSARTQRSVAARFVREGATALDRLRQEQAAAAAGVTPAAEAPVAQQTPVGPAAPTSALIPPPRPEGLAAQSSAPVTAPPGTTAQAPAPWYSQYDGNHVVDAGDDACFRAVTAMAQDAGVTVQGSNRIIQVGTSENGNGRLTVDSAQAQAGREYIDGQLDRGRPVAVGVSHKDAAYNVDQLTDHFVLITGRGVDEQGRTFYTFHDPGTRRADVGPDTNPNNRFYVDDSTGMMYRPGPHEGFVVDRGYDVSMVRLNAE